MFNLLFKNIKLDIKLFIYLGTPGLPGSYQKPTPYPGTLYPSGPGT